MKLLNMVMELVHNTVMQSIVGIQCRLITQKDYKSWLTIDINVLFVVKNVKYMEKFQKLVEIIYNRIDELEKHDKTEKNMARLNEMNLLLDEILKIVKS